MKQAHTNVKHKEITYGQLFAYIKFHGLSMDDPISVVEKDEIDNQEIFGIEKIAISDKKEVRDSVEENTCLLIMKRW